MSERLEKLVSPGQTGSDVRVTKTPENWRPRLELDPETGGYLISTPRKAGNSPDADQLLEEFDLNPVHWTVTSVRRSKWQTYNGEWLEAYRLSLAPASELDKYDEDLDRLMDEVRKWRPKPQKMTSGELAYVVAPSDQQIGKKANGQGSAESVDRILCVTEGAIARLAELRKIGRPIGTTVLALLGDHVEGNVSQSGRLQSTAASDLGQTQQTRVARRLLMAQIKAFAPLTESVIVAVVNGNHDEVTRQVVADPQDGWNVEIAAAVQDACAENPALQNVQFRYPESDHQTLTVNVCGTLLGLFHGHQTGRGDVVKYLSQQAAGQTSLGGADVWLSGHFHHFKTLDIGKRLWAQAPTTDPGSPWFRDRAGLESQPGLLTMVIGDGHNPRRDISIIEAAFRE